MCLDEIFAGNPVEEDLETCASKSVAQSACESEHDGLPMTDTCNVVISGALKTLIL